MNADDATPLTPAARARPGCRGTPVEIDGQTWLFADYVPDLDEVWDALYDKAYLSGRFEAAHVTRAGMRLLFAGYDVTPEETAGLACAAPLGAMKAAVEAALFGPPKVHRTYSQWALGSLYANGIDPAAVPGPMLVTVLDMLVMSGRAIPLDMYITSRVDGKKLGWVRGMTGGAPKQAPPGAPPDGSGS